MEILGILEKKDLLIKFIVIATDPKRALPFAVPRRLSHRHRYILLKYIYIYMV